MNVPKLRFPEFHDDYEELKYKNILKIKSGKNQKFVECKNGKYPILGTGGKIGETNNFLFDKPSVLIGRKGTINKPQYLEIPFWTVDTLFYTDIFYPNIPKYIYYTFQNVNWEKYDESTGVPSLNASTIESIKCNIPHYTEQQKVADFFSLLDKKIEFQAQKIEALKLFKIGISQVMFKTANINKNLEEIALVQKGEQISSNNILSKGKYAVINGGIKPSGFLNKYNTEGNTITISEGGNSCGYVNFITQNFWCSGHCYSIKPKNKINNIYLYQLLKLHEKKLMVLRVGSGLPNIQKKDLEEYNLQIHDIGSQTVIAIILTKIDNYIILNENKSLKLQKLKKGLMQNMFI